MIDEAVMLCLPYPISANRYWESRVIQVKGTRTWRSMTYVSAEAKLYREQVQWIARAAGIRAPIVGRVELGYRLYPKRPMDFKTRIRELGEAWDDGVQCIDLGNAEKVMTDALQGIVITNDCMVRRLVGERMAPDEQGARLMVWVRPIAAEQMRLVL